MCTGTRPGLTPAIRAGKGWRGRRELAPRCSATQLVARRHDPGQTRRSLNDKNHTPPPHHHHTTTTTTTTPPPPPPHTRTTHTQHTTHATHNTRNTQHTQHTHNTHNTHTHTHHTHPHTHTHTHPHTHTHTQNGLHVRIWKSPPQWWLIRWDRPLRRTGED